MASKKSKNKGKEKSVSRNMGDGIEDASVGRQTLERTPERVLQFLRAVGTSLPIRAALMQRGYSREDHAEGWSLLHETAGFVGGDEDVELEDASVRDAIRELDGWDEDGLRVIGATLRRRHPKVAEFVMRGLRPATGAASVVVVKTLLDRLDALASGKGRDDRREDRAALATLARRGYGDAERDRLRKLVRAAQSAKEVSIDPDLTLEAEEQYLGKLAKLRSWYEEQADLARSVVKKRAHLIRLGLAARRPATGGAEANGNGADEEEIAADGDGRPATGDGLDATV